MKQIKFSLENIEEYLEEISQIIKDYSIILLEGEMGAGKTTLVKYLAAYMNVDGEVQSPSYALINEYHLTKEDGSIEKWIHSDWFRIEDESEAWDVGFEELLEEENHKHFIEWSSKINNLIPSEHLLIRIEKTGETSRELTFIVPEK